MSSFHLFMSDLLSHFIEMLFPGYMSHIIGIQERLNRFSGLPFIHLSCGYRPHIVFKKIFHDINSDESSYDMAIVPMLR